jgi:alpha-amylase/alpha-mannosidase (GH57 family)
MNPNLGVAIAPAPVTTGVFVTVHGHFYQPPREHPDLETIAHQPSASPFHDWNERIYHECYRPNAFARIYNDNGDVVEIINNYEYLSFNFGPTLLSWLERYDPQVYQRILDADYKSRQRLQGHGNAIAQVFNHIIMPLANRRDKITQVRWGKADFRSRFHRDPEGMWLAETAVDAETLEVLIDEGIKFIVLAPSQAQRCRPIPADESPVLVDGELQDTWLEVGGSQIDPTRPYRCYLPQPENSAVPQRYIDIFFYDGPVSRDMGFSDMLQSSSHFAARLGQVVRGDRQEAQLISVATDGETFGHHKSGAEKALAYALVSEFPRRGFTVTNFAHYLSLCPPTWEVELKPVTAWSCAHGVDRWQADCGCGGEGSIWHQRWRRPLRQTLDWLRDQLSHIFTQEGSKLFLDPWQSRDDYIDVILSRGLSANPAVGGESSDRIERFLTLHQHHPLSPAEQVDALRLLEMQRQTLLMYTSCGWFFEELSRPEGVQILRYAGRAMALAADLTGQQFEPEFTRRLDQAPSNVPLFGHGGEVYRQLVKSAQISLNQVAANYAISSVFAHYPREQRLFCYHIVQQDYQRQHIGVLTLAVGQLQITSELTRESVHLDFAVLHLGGWDFHCCVQTHQGRSRYGELKQQLFAALETGSAAQLVLTMTAGLGDRSFGLSDLLPEERQRLMTLLTHETLVRLEQLYTQVYRDNYGMLLGWQRDGLAVPKELQVAAQITLSHRINRCVRELEQELSPAESCTLGAGQQKLNTLFTIAAEARALGCQLDLASTQVILERLVLSLVWQLVYNLNTCMSAGQLIPCLQKLLDVGTQLELRLNLDQPQELFLQFLHHQMTPQSHQAVVATSRPIGSLGTFREPVAHQQAKMELTAVQIQQLLSLGQQLHLDVSLWQALHASAFPSTVTGHPH